MLLKLSWSETCPAGIWFKNGVFLLDENFPNQKLINGALVIPIHEAFHKISLMYIRCWQGACLMYDNVPAAIAWRMKDIAYKLEYV